jgi:hypothetical protein
MNSVDSLKITAYIWRSSLSYSLEQKCHTNGKGVLALFQQANTPTIYKSAEDYSELIY